MTPARGKPGKRRWKATSSPIEAPIPALGKLLSDLGSEPLVYLFDVSSPCGEEADEASIVTHQRLFPRIADIRWRGRVHEQLSPQPTSLGMRWMWADIR